jgi:hypothetical protein
MDLFGKLQRAQGTNVSPTSRGPGANSKGTSSIRKRETLLEITGSVRRTTRKLDAQISSTEQCKAYDTCKGTNDNISSKTMTQREYRRAGIKAGPRLWTRRLRLVGGESTAASSSIRRFLFAERGAGIVCSAGESCRVGEETCKLSAGVTDSSKMPLWH